jgi:hypothetical protein
MTHRKRSAALLPAAALLAALALAQAAPASAASVTISPLAGTPSATPRTQISFLGAAAKTLSGISVVGSSSGRHRGRLRSYAALTGTSFVPSTPFAPGERVTVRAKWHYAKGRTRALSDSFTIAQPAVIPLVEFPAAPGTPAQIQSFASAPALHPPVITVTHPASAASAPGYLFASPFLGPGQWGPMIFDPAMAWRPTSTSSCSRRREPRGCSRTTPCRPASRAPAGRPAASRSTVWSRRSTCTPAS